MKIGVIARADPRGLGIQTLETVRHLHPDRVLLVEPRPEGWPQNRQWYDGYPVTRAVWRRSQLPEQIVKPWLDGLDVVYSAETFYDSRFPAWCRSAGVTPVRHANPEQLGPEEIRDDGTVWWAATDWRLDHLPGGTRVVPMPVATERFTFDRDELPRPVRFLHSVGHVAQDDRAGSRCVVRAIRELPHRELVVRCQDRRMEANFDLPNVRMLAGGIANYWDQYAGCDVLVLPRRYGGLSLPSQEAMAAGLVLVMTDCSPNRTWPGPKIPVRKRGTIHLRCGPVEVCDADPHALADTMERIAVDRDELARLQTEARTWATANSWDALLPKWLDELTRASASSFPSSATAQLESERLIG
jgi:glycosyltransferase involved in cell wall biosynthesis